MRKTLGGLRPGALGLYELLVADLGLDADLREFQASSSQVCAAHWECLWRVAPWVADEAWGEGEFEYHSNPFFEVEVEESFLDRGKSVLVPEAATEVLKTARRVEQERAWPHGAAGALTSEPTKDEDATLERPALISRLMLRGELAGTLEALRALVQSHNATEYDEETEREESFLNDILPAFLLAYARIRPTDDYSGFGKYASELMSEVVGPGERSRLVVQMTSLFFKSGGGVPMDERGEAAAHWLDQISSRLRSDQ
jgi:hypothetical protein